MLWRDATVREHRHAPFITQSDIRVLCAGITATAQDSTPAADTDGNTTLCAVSMIIAMGLGESRLFLATMMRSLTHWVHRVP